MTWSIRGDGAPPHVRRCATVDGQDIARWPPSVGLTGTAHRRRLLRGRVPPDWRLADGATRSRRDQQPVRLLSDSSIRKPTSIKARRALRSLGGGHRGSAARASGTGREPAWSRWSLRQARSAHFVQPAFVACPPPIAFAPDWPILYESRSLKSAVASAKSSASFWFLSMNSSSPLLSRSVQYRPFSRRVGRLEISSTVEP